jgi:hypothetical protein
MYQVAHMINVFDLQGTQQLYAGFASVPRANFLYQFPGRTIQQKHKTIRFDFGELSMEVLRVRCGRTLHQSSQWHGNQAPCRWPPALGIAPLVY